MHKANKILALIMLLTVCLAVPACAAGITEINDLVEQAEDCSGKTVTVQGEAIGEALERDGYAWVNLSDGTNAIGIWLSSADAKAITFFGDYKNIGDTVRITGTFSRNCIEHGGDVDIHNASIEIIRKGHTVSESPAQDKLVAAAILFCIALGAVGIYIRSAKKRSGK